MTKQQILAALAARGIDQLLGSGVTVSELARAGVAASELIDAGVTASQMIRAGVTAAQLTRAGFTASELVDSGFTASQLADSGFTASQLVESGVTVSDLIRAGVTVSQLVRGYSTADVPTVEKPYSRMLAAIESRAIIHDQSDYGPGHYDCGPETDSCGTPMCTASHLVAMAGEAGAKLLDACDGNLPLAAGLIHAMSRPDAPCQDFGSIPQEWALAYIRERASEE